jgi:hypothetical protein
METIASLTDPPGTGLLESEWLQVSVPVQHLSCSTSTRESMLAELDAAREAMAAVEHRSEVGG